MKIYIAVVEDHTFDNKWDSYSHIVVFKTYDEAIEWTYEKAKKLIEDYEDAEIYEDSFPTFITEDTPPFVCITIKTQEL